VTNSPPGPLFPGGKCNWEKMDLVAGARIYDVSHGSKSSTDRVIGSGDVVRLCRRARARCNTAPRPSRPRFLPTSPNGDCSVGRRPGSNSSVGSYREAVVALT
jgi:hypothetical protein